MDKKRIIVIILLVLVFVCFLVALIVKNNSKDKNIKIEDSNTIVFKGDYTDPSIIDIENDLLKSEHCDDNICVSIMKISCNEGLGSIYYKITNKDNTKKDGYFKITIEKNDFYLRYTNLGVGESFESFYNYKDVNLMNAKDFKLTILDDSYSKKYK